MNRHQRRAAKAQDRTRRASPLTRADAIRLTLGYLAHAAAPTATGATIFHPDGTATYVSAEDAQAMAGDAPARGRA